MRVARLTNGREQALDVNGHWWTVASQTRDVAGLHVREQLFSTTHTSTRSSALPTEK